VVSPGRSEGGRRLYSDEDIERLNLLRRATAGGHSVGMVAKLGDQELRAMVAEVEAAASATVGVEGKVVTADETLAQCMAYVRDLDSVSLERTLRRAAVVFGVWDLVLKVVVPLIHEVGEQWHSGQISPAHEHMASAVISRALSWVMDSTASAESAPVIVAATPTGETHELGAMLAAASAAAEGWRVVYLGADLPAKDIANAAVQVGARAVALSVVYPDTVTGAASEVSQLRGLLPPGVAVVVGGSAMEPDGLPPGEGVLVVGDISEFPSVLERLESN